MLSWLLGWCDFALYAIFETGLIAADQVYFLEFNFPKKSANMTVRACVKVFIFQKITGILKINIFFKNCQIISFNLKEHLPKRKFEIECLNIFFSFLRQFSVQTNSRCDEIVWI